MMRYKYYLNKFGNYYTEIYRIPDNGKSFHDNISLLEKYVKDGIWSDSEADCRQVFDEYFNGNFSHRSAEITEEKAVEIMKLIDASEV